MARASRSGRKKSERVQVATPETTGVEPYSGKVQFKYIFPDSYNPVYANGVYGGISPQGEIVINFFHERQALLYSQTNKVSGGIIAQELNRDPKSDMPVFVRFITAGVVMSPDSAKKIYDWLGEKLTILGKINREPPTQ